MSASSLFDSLRPASFRGVAFEVDDHDENGGRRLAKHEYPLRDIPYAEDLGRKAGAWRINAFLIHHKGFDVPKSRDELRKALNAAGPGTLIHPWLGELEVCVDDFSLRETNWEGGYVQFSISFVEAGMNANPKAEPDTAAAADGAASAAESPVAEALADALGAAGIDNVIPAIAEAFAMVQNITNLPQRLIADALGVVGQMAAGPLAIAGKVFGVVGWVMGLCGGSNFSSLFPGNVLASLGLSLPEFGAAGKEGGTRSAAQNPSQGIAAAVAALLGGTAANTGADAVTASGTAMDAAHRLVASALICGATRAVAQTDFATADDALAARDELADALDTLMDCVPDDVYGPLADLRVAVVRDLGMRGAKLPRLARITLPGTLPALAAAYRIHGDAARDAEIISRNHIRHPGRVPGGTPLEVLL